MNRRQILSAGSASGAALMLGARAGTTEAAVASGGVPAVVDVHGHAITGTLETLLSLRDSRDLDGRALPRWSVESALAFQDSHGIGLQLLSTPDPALTLAPPEWAEEIARAINDEIAAICRQAPTRFAGLAVLPLSAGAGAAGRELTRATQTLKMAGVILPTNVRGRLLGESVFQPVLAELSR